KYQAQLIYFPARLKLDLRTPGEPVNLKFTIPLSHASQVQSPPNSSPDKNSESTLDEAIVLLSRCLRCTCPTVRAWLQTAWPKEHFRRRRSEGGKGANRESEKVQ